MLAFALLDLTFDEVISDIPLNAGTLLVFAIFAAFAVGIWYGSRPNLPRSPGADVVDGTDYRNEEVPKRGNPTAL